MTRARWAGRILVAVIAAVFAIDVAAVAREWSRLRPVASGVEAPAFELPRIGPEGRIGPEAVSLSSLRGKVVVIDFWETWCRPCHDAMPALDRVAVRHREDGVVFLSVCSDGTRQPRVARRAGRNVPAHESVAGFRLRASGFGLRAQSQPLFKITDCDLKEST